MFDWTASAAVEFAAALARLLYQHFDPCPSKTDSRVYPTSRSTSRPSGGVPFETSRRAPPLRRLSPLARRLADCPS